MENIKELKEEIKYYIQHGITDGMLNDAELFDDVVGDILAICILNKHLLVKTI